MKGVNKNRKEINMHTDTTILHGYPMLDPVTGAASISKCQTSTFHQNDFPKAGQYTYTRFSNPTIHAAELAVMALEKAKYGIACSSGMGAISATLLTLKSGDHIVLGKDIYGGTFQLIHDLMNNFGITYTQIDETDTGAWEKAIQENTKLFYLETPSNPLLKITDLQAVCQIAKKHHIISVCDNTFMTPLVQSPFELGCDVVIHSATKFLGGHSDIVMGIALTNDEKIAQNLEKNKRILGSCPGIEESWLLLRGIKTLAVRMEKACHNAQFLAENLRTLDKVKQVYYPGLPTHDGFAINQKQAKNGGAVLSFELENAQQVEQLFHNVTIPIVAVSLGGVESILSYPWSMSHACMPESDRIKAGVTPTLIRLSCGIENPEDLLHDIKDSLM
jgi:cystathionine beta-lyase